MSEPALTPAQAGFIERVMSDIREGCASTGDVARMRELLAGSREARRLYLRGLQLDCLLQTDASETAGFGRTNLQTRVGKRFTILAFVIVGLAAVFVFLAIFTKPDFGGEPPSARTTVKAVLAVLVSDVGQGLKGESGLVRDSLQAGKYSMAEGVARIDFSNGTQLVLEAPVEFEILGESAISVVRGKVWAFCPLEAHGFKIATPGGREVVDMGTEFGVGVSAAGETEVHVFEGRVDLLEPGREDIRITTGKAVSWSAARPAVRVGDADYSKFNKPGDLVKMRVGAFRDIMKNRKDLVVYYGFSKPSGELLENGVGGSPTSSNGVIEGAQVVSGRLAGSAALRFENPGDSVAFTIPHYGELGSFTIAMWIRVDHLDTALSALLNCDGWERGDTHFQITRGGALRAGIQEGWGYESPDGILVPGGWHLVAVVWDRLTKVPAIYCDGKRLTLMQVPNGDSLSPSGSPSSLPGECRIGNWAKSTLRDDRNFKGTIDEVMVFGGKLDDSDIREIYENGKP